MPFKPYHPEKGIISQPAVEIHADGTLILNREMAERSFLSSAGQNQSQSFQILVDEKEKRIAITFKYEYSFTEGRLEVTVGDNGQWEGSVYFLLRDFDWLQPGIYEPKRNRSQQWELTFKQDLFDTEVSKVKLLSDGREK